MTGLSRRRVCAGIATAACLTVRSRPARAEALAIRLGYSLAAEEQLWLLMADHSLAKNYAKLYTLDATRFTSS
jgi:hypothetical protein